MPTVLDDASGFARCTPPKSFQVVGFGFDSPKRRIGPTGRSIVGACSSTLAGLRHSAACALGCVIHLPVQGSRRRRLNSSSSTRRHTPRRPSGRYPAAVVRPVDAWRLECGQVLRCRAAPRHPRLHRGTGDIPDRQIPSPRQVSSVCIPQSQSHFRVANYKC